MKKQDIKSISRDQLKSFLIEHGEKPFRADQILHWVYNRYLEKFEDMDNIPKATRLLLEEHFRLTTLTEAVSQQSQDGTIKWAFKTEDGHLIESVLIPNMHRQSICISTQVGCAMGCSFCRTAKMGLKRNLKSGEIIEQFMFINKHLKKDNLELSNVVFMGMGEPLQNLRNLEPVIEIMHDSKIYGLAKKRITLSTSGLVPRIMELADKNLPCKLAISLNGTNDEVRTSIMPINKSYDIQELIQAAQYYVEKTNNHITFEYILIKDKTCTPQAAEELLEISRQVDCKINAIVLNDNDDEELKQPSEAEIDDFLNRVRAGGTYIIIRTPRGRDIKAACGQLAVHQKKVA